MGIGDFRHVGIVQAVTSIPDGGGGLVEAWTDLPPPWRIDIRPATVRDLERQTAGTTVATATHIVHGRYRPDVKVDARILWDPGSDPIFPRDGLVAYWPLDEPGGVRRDRMGRANLTEHNGVGSGPGRVGVGAKFQQVNSQYLGITHAGLDTGNSDFTLTAWINLATVSQCVVLGKDAGNGRDYALDVSDLARARFTAYRSNDEAVVTSSGPDLVAGTWYFLAVLHDAAAETIAIQVNDGPVDVTSTAGVALNQTAAEFRIGSRARSPIAEFFDGMIDEVGIWKRVLAPAERSALYNSGAGLAAPPLRALRIAGIANPQERNRDLFVFAKETL
jgi:head-tail adaptor